MRLVWRAIGIVAFVLALVGTALPIMPTVPFLIVAAYAFDRSSPRFHHMLMSHRIFGPQIRNWRQYGAISPRVKLVACASMAVGLCISLFILPFHYWLVQVALLTAVALFVVSRPAPPQHP